MKTRFSVMSATFFFILMVQALAAQSPKQQPDTKPAANAAASVDDQIISESSLEESIQAKLTSLKAQEYNLKRQALDEEIDKLLLQKEAAHRSLTVDQLIQKEVEDKVGPATQEQIKAVYDATKDKYINTTNADAFREIAANLREARIDLRRKDFLKDLLVRSNVHVYLQAPRVAMSGEDSRSRGPKNAPVTIVEFAEFQCPYCSRSAATVRQLEERYRDQIRIVFRDFPLSFHQSASKAAEAASCANDQGKFWEMHDKLFANQSNLKTSDLRQYASQIALNADQFNQCLDSEKYARRWQADREEGARYGITATPTFFINGRMLVGALPLEKFTQLIDEELERAASLKSPPSRASGDGAD